VLVDAQIRTDEELKQTNEAVRNLTAVVDRYFRERNGWKDSE
jgi:single-stranded DNA-binding protein